MRSVGSGLDMVFGGKKVGEAIGTRIAKMMVPPEAQQYVSPGPSGREVAGSALQSASLFFPVGRAAGVGTQAARALGLRGLSKTAGAIASGAGAGYGFDVATNLQDTSKGIGEVLTPGTGTAIGAAIPGAGAALGGIARGAKSVAQNVAPKLLSYTTDIPEQAFDTLISRRESVAKAIKAGGTPEEALNATRGAVRQLRTTLSREWDEGVNSIADEFTGKRVGLAGNLERKIDTLADEFGVRVPQNIKSASVVEWMDTLKSINELPRLMAQVSPKGAIIREAKNELKDILVKEFGGDTGSLATLYRNYAAKKTVFDSANQIVQAYSSGKPIQQSTAVGRLKALFNDNKAAYLDAILQLEKETGQDLLSRITALQFQSKLPKTGTVLSASGGLKSSKGPLDKAVDLLLIPLTSPRAAAWIVNALNKQKGVSPSMQKLFPKGSAVSPGDRVLDAGDEIIDTVKTTPGKQGGYLGGTQKTISQAKASGQSFDEWVKGQGTGKSLDVNEIVPDDVMSIIDKRFTQITSVELPEKLYSGWDGITLGKLSDEIEKLGIGEEVFRQSASELRKKGYGRLGDVLITDE